MFSVDPLSRTPVYEQIVEQCEQYVLLGVLCAGDRLPSVRQLSVELSINPNTIQKAYIELDRRGMVTAVPGRGVFISPDAFDKISVMKQENLNEIARLARELKQAQTPVETVIDCVREAYGEETK